jgi:hypothetical protein
MERPLTEDEYERNKRARAYLINNLKIKAARFEKRSKQWIIVIGVLAIIYTLVTCISLILESFC